MSKSYWWRFSIRDIVWFTIVVVLVVLTLQAQRAASEARREAVMANEHAEATKNDAAFRVEKFINIARQIRSSTDKEIEILKLQMKELEAAHDRTTRERDAAQK